MSARPTEPLELIEELIARTACSFEGAAQTSAFKACELIRRNRFAVVDPRMLPPPKAEISRVVLVSKYLARCKECGWVPTTFRDAGALRVDPGPFPRRRRLQALAGGEGNPDLPHREREARPNDLPDELRGIAMKPRSATPNDRPTAGPAVPAGTQPRPGRARSSFTAGTRSSGISINAIPGWRGKRTVAGARSSGLAAGISEVSVSSSDIARRRSQSVRDGFEECVLFMLHRLSCRNQPCDVIPGFRVNHGDDDVIERPDADPALVPVVPPVVRKRRHRPIEHPRGILEIQPALPDVAVVLLRIPDKPHGLTVQPEPS